MVIISRDVIFQHPPMKCIKVNADEKCATLIIYICGPSWFELRVLGLEIFTINHRKDTYSDLVIRESRKFPTPKRTGGASSP